MVFQVICFFRYVKQFLDKQQEDKPKILSTQKRPVYISFPFYGYISEKVRYDLKDTVYRRFPQINIKLFL